MARRRFVWSKEENALVEVPMNRPRDTVAPTVWDDLPAYESPIDGRPVEGRKQRRDDLARSGCRPYEGLAAESQEAAKYRAEQDRKLDRKVDESVHRSWHELPERVRRTLRNRSG